MVESNTNVLVLGGGPAGISAAVQASRLQASVTLVTDGPVGGRAGWHSLLPSKVWLGSASTASALEAAPEVGFADAIGAGTLDENKLLAHLAEVKQQWNQDQAAWLQQLGVKTISGKGRFSGPQSVEVTEGNEVLRLSADYVVIATGSVPYFPPELKPDGKRVIAPRFASSLEKLPASIVVIGGGATGSEFAYLFNRLGVKVTWIIDEYGVLPGYLPELGDFLRDSLEAAGVVVVAGSGAQALDRQIDGVVVHTASGAVIPAEMAFVAIGRRPDLSGLDLQAAAVDVRDDVVIADAFGRTSNPQVYVAGDAAGGRLVANKAMSQGAIAVSHALGASPQPYDAQQTVLATYTDPEIAQVGNLTDDTARLIRVSSDIGLKGRLEGHMAGFVLLAFRPESGQLIGGAAAGSHAADTLAPLALALRLGATVGDLSALYVGHPTASELLFAAAREASVSTAM